MMESKPVIANIYFLRSKRPENICVRGRHTAVN